MRAGRKPWFALTTTIGLVFIAAWAGVIPVDSERLNAPRWLLAAIGLMYLLLGHAIAFATERGARGWSAAGGVSAMAALFGWVAFGSSSADPITQALFGVFAVFMALLVLVLLFHELERAMGWSGEEELYELAKRLDREPGPRRPPDP